MSERKRQQAHNPARVYPCICTECINVLGNEGGRVELYEAAAVAIRTYYHWWKSVQVSKP